MDDCLGCDLIEGRRELPGGRIHATGHWVVEHCIGPLPVGTLIVKPFRHCERFFELSDDEVREFGPLLHLVTRTIQEILAPDQIYVCQWSHAGWTPGHLHFVVQPSWNRWRETYDRPGPFLQTDMFEADEHPRREEIEAFCDRARKTIRAFSSPV
jgi:diadenosine tetraphosphate (Ap4A) HIT family hydrolase